MIVVGESKHEWQVDSIGGTDSVLAHTLELREAQGWDLVQIILIYHGAAYNYYSVVFKRLRGMRFNDPE